jgi:hypothetical protein
VQGHDLNDASVTFATMGDHTRPWLQLAAVAHGVALIGNLLLTVHFLRLFFSKPAPVAFGQSAALEASAS